MKNQEVSELCFPDGPSELGHEGNPVYLKVFLVLFAAGLLYLGLIFSGVLS